MKSLNECIREYGMLMYKGDMPRAYRGIIDFILQLRAHFQKNYPEYSVSGTIHQGYMDVTFFTIIPVSLRERKLKTVLLFNHERISFEIWLSGVNKQVQEKFLDYFSKGNWDNYRLPFLTGNPDSILECDLVTNPDFDHPEILMQEIEKGAGRFIREVEQLLYKTGI